MLSTDMFSGFEMVNNALEAGALHRTPPRELTTLP